MKTQINTLFSNNKKAKVNLKRVSRLIYDDKSVLHTKFMCVAEKLKVH